MSQQGLLKEGSSGAPNIETITGNSGGPVGPDGAFNINVVGSAPIDVTGNPGTNTLTIDTDGSVATDYPVDNGGPGIPSSDSLAVLGSTASDFTGSGLETHVGATTDEIYLENRRWITQYVVDSSTTVGERGTYSTIQAAINAADAAGGGIIIIRAGTYTEDLTIPGNIDLRGAGSSVGDQATIDGTHTLTVDDSITISDLSFQNSGAGDIFTISSGTEFFVMNDCFFFMGANGLLTSAVSTVISYIKDSLIISNSTDPILNLSAGIFLCLRSTVGTFGSNGTFGASGTANLQIESSNFSHTITAEDTSSVTFIHSSCGIGGSAPAFNVVDAGASLLATQCYVDCSDAGGDFAVGAGTFEYGDLTLNGSATGIAGTLTESYLDWKPYSTAGASEPAVVKGTCGFDSAMFSVTDGFVTATGTLPIQFDTDSGSAVPASGIIEILGGNGTTSSGSGNTVTVEMQSPFTGDFTFTDSTAADTEILTVSNTDNTAASDSGASLQVNVGGTTQTGDPYISLGTGSSIAYSLGTDTDDSQIFKINTDSASSVTPSTGSEIFLLNSSSDSAIGTLSLGHDGVPEIDINFTINGSALEAILSIDAQGATDLGGIIDHRHTNTAAFGANWIGLRSRGTHASSTIVQNNDVLSRILAGGYDGTDYAQSAEIRAEVDGTPGANDMPGRWVFLTSPDGSQTPTEALRISQDQSISFTQYTQNSLLYIGASGLVTEIGPLSDGELIIGDTGNPPQASTLTAGTGISISNAAGSITIDSSGGGISWTEVTVTGATAMSVNNGYVANNAGTVGLTLPATASIGDVIKVDGKGAGGWSIGQNAGQTIHFLAQDTTTGAGGSLASTTQYDCVTLRCITANTDFVVEAVTGNLTVT
jgi:hypothetical protein